MRLNDIIIENTLDEAPKGFLSRAKDAVLSKVPGSIGAKAQGRRESGAEANWLKKQFDTFLGKTNQQATPKVVIDFLKKNNYPTGEAEKEMSKLTTGQKAAQAAGKGAAVAAKGATAVAKGTADVAKGAVAGAKNAVAKTNTPQQTAPKQNTTQPQQQTKPPVALSGVKNAPPQQQKKVVNQSIDWSEAKFIFEAEAALANKQLDKIFMAAVQQAIARDEGGQADTGTGAAPNDAAVGGVGSQMKQGFEKGMQKPGDSLPQEIKDEIAKLSSPDKQQLTKMLDK